jgi:hypothetical protein
MELACPDSIRALMRAHGMPARVGRCRGSQDAARPAHNDRRVRCQCGQCHQCLEDARWERIFAKKFADPNYYTRHSVRCSSPLTSL